VILRSYLFVPGNRPDRFGKAFAAGADAVIFDLEDAVAPSDKPAARTHVARALAVDRPAIIRVNGFGTEWFAEDVALCARPGVAAVMIPKVEQVEHLEAVRQRVDGGTAVLPLVETAAAIWNVESLARALGVQRLVFGALDLTLDLGVSGDDESLLYCRSRIVLASRVAGIQPPIDAPTTTFVDPVVVRADADRARRLGFAGKLCIHPAQIAPVHDAFAPSDAELAWARRVLVASAQSGGAATSLDGQMVDTPVVVRARAILSCTSDKA
jgi:citrate lyase subunit beta / citryl-CoA lyase